MRHTTAFNFPGLFSVTLLALAILFSCGQGQAPAESKSASKGVSAMNIFTEILQFPDPDAEKRTGGTGKENSREPELFAEKFGKVYEEIIKRWGGSEPLEGPAKTKFSREMMAAQAAILFDMRLSASHDKRERFLETVVWSFDQRQPIDLRRQKLIDRGPAYFKEADIAFNKEVSALQAQVKKKLKIIFTPADYYKLTGEK